jgi:hypothetical protein
MDSYSILPIPFSLLFIFCVVLRIKAKASCLLGKCSTTGLHPLSLKYYLNCGNGFTDCAYVKMYLIEHIKYAECLICQLHPQ